MYPGGNNYDQNYPNQQPGYNVPPQQYGGAPGYPAGGPPAGFNVGAPGYGPAPTAAYGGYNQYPNNPQPFMPPTQSYAPQGQYMPGQSFQQYPQGQCPSVNVQGYGDAHHQMPAQQMPGQYMPGQQMSGQQMPGQQMPGQQMPGQQMPGQQMPGQQMPGQQMPGHQIPGQHMPGQHMTGQQIQQGYGSGFPQQSPAQNTAFPHMVSNTNFGPNASSQEIINCIGSGGESFRGTMKPHPNFNVEQDCNIIKKAMKGLGTDEKSILECLGRRNYSQRLEIKRTFKTMFGKDLLDELKSEISGNFSRAVIESLYDSDYYDAYSLHKAMEGAGTREDVLTEILTSRSNQQINNIKDLYKKCFKKDLEKNIISETSGFYKRVLVSCLQANKKELTGDEIARLRQQGPSAVINVALAKQEAQELYNAGEKKIGTDEACFIKIFATRNKYQLRATFDEYQRIAGRDIRTSIEREMSGDLSSALKAIAMQATNPSLFFATRLYSAIKGAGTNDTALIRILLTRSEIDLDNIKNEFQKQYGKSLATFVAEDCSGDYLKYLLRFVEGN